MLRKHLAAALALALIVTPPAAVLSTAIVLTQKAFGRDGPAFHQDRSDLSDEDRAAADYRSRWFQSLQQPDQPNMSCCGQADAWYCDSLHMENIAGYGMNSGDPSEEPKPQAVCLINDDRNDAELGRPHIDNGTKVRIPDNKLMNAQQIHGANPTGHGVVFLSRGGYVWCYVESTGV